MSVTRVINRSISIVSVPPPHQGGFVLIAVLGLIAVISLVAAFIGSYAEGRLQQAVELRNSWQQQLDQQATLATLLHLVATRPRGNQGFELTSANDPERTSVNTLVVLDGQLAADGRAYRGIGTIDFAIQDEGPLLSVLDADPVRWQPLLTRFGLTTAQVDRVVDLVNDYTDQDDLSRLNGANDAQYLARGLTLPRHRFMVGPGELNNLLDAPAWQNWLPDLMPLVTARSGMLLNLNTMPESLLASRFDDRTAAELVRLRRMEPFHSLQDANQRLGQLLPIAEEQIPSIVSAFHRIILWSGATSVECRQAQWIGISLSPSSFRAPWEFDYAFTYNHNRACQSAEQVVVEPLFPAPMAG